MSRYQHPIHCSEDKQHYNYGKLQSFKLFKLRIICDMTNIVVGLVGTLYWSTPVSHSQCGIYYIYIIHIKKKYFCLSTHMATLWLVHRYTITQYILLDSLFLETQVTQLVQRHRYLLATYSASWCRGIGNQVPIPDNDDKTYKIQFYNMLSKFQIDQMTFWRSSYL